MFSRLRLTRAIAAAVTFILLTAPVALASSAYGGYIPNSSWEGVDGYIRQSGTVSTTAAHFDWITVCNNANCDEWVQQGTTQGCWNGGCSTSSVVMYTEILDVCGDYYPTNWSAPPSPDYPYYLYYNGGGARTILCLNGSKRTGYYFDFARGSLGGVFTQGALDTTTGEIQAATEVNPPGSVIGTDYYGCDASKSCGNQSYGMHLYNGSSWTTWTAASTKLTGNPPFVHTYNNYWSFATCPISC